MKRRASGSRRQTSTVVLPPMFQPNPALAPAYTTGHLRRLTGLTASHIASLWRMKALTPEVSAPQGRGHDLLFSLRNVRQFVVLRRLLAGGLRLREALDVIRRLDEALIGRDASSWVRGHLLPQFDRDRRRAARNPHVFWATDTLRWLAGERAVLVVRRVQSTARREIQVDVRIVRSDTPLAEVMPADHGLVLTAQLVDLTGVWQVAGDIPPDGP